MRNSLNFVKGRAGIASTFRGLGREVRKLHFVFEGMKISCQNLFEDARSADSTLPPTLAVFDITEEMREKKFLWRIHDTPPAG